MSAAGEALRTVQAVDARVAAARAALEAVRTELRADPALERARTASDAATAERTAADAAASAAEAEWRTLEARVRTLDRRLYGGSVHNPHELLEMQRELEVLREQLRVAETAALEAMEESESAATRGSAAADALAQADAQRTASLAPLREREQQLDAALADATAERAATAASVDPRDLALYERVAAKHQPAVVSIVGDVCGGCHLPLSIEERRAARTGTSLVQCSGCDRILVP